MFPLNGRNHLDILSDSPLQGHFLASIESPALSPSAILRAWGQSYESEGQAEPHTSWNGWYFEVLKLCLQHDLPEQYPFVEFPGHCLKAGAYFCLQSSLAHMLSISWRPQHMDPVTSIPSLLENILILSEKTAFTF